MSTPTQASDGKQSVQRAVEAAIRIGLVFLLAAWCFLIVEAVHHPDSLGNDHRHRELPYLSVDAELSWAAVTSWRRPCSPCWHSPF